MAIPPPSPIQPPVTPQETSLDSYVKGPKLSQKKRKKKEREARAAGQSAITQNASDNENASPFIEASKTTGQGTIPQNTLDNLNAGEFG